MKKQLVLAAVQMHSKKGENTANYKKAEGFVKLAAEKGAEMVLFPELFSCGYVPNIEIWKYAEKRGGDTFEFLREMSGKYRLCVGAGVLEKERGHYLNSYLLVDKNGELICRAVKDKAESYVFKRNNDAAIFDTEFGRIGIGICADNHFSEFIKRMQREKINILLMPHAMPVPYKETGTAKKADIDKLKNDLITFPELVAGLLGISTVFINQTGELYPMAGLLGKSMSTESYRIGGHSKIVSGSGEVIAEMKEEEGMALASVNIAGKSSEAKKVPDYQGWIQKGSPFLRRVVLPLDIFLGRLYYNLKRKSRSQRP